MQITLSRQSAPPQTQERQRPFWVDLALPLFACGWMLFWTWPGLFVDLHPDDLTNLYKAWVLSPEQLAWANLSPFTSVYRPLGALVYRTIFAVQGLDPFGYRLFAYGLLAANIVLLYQLALRLSGSRLISFLSALLWSFHPRLLDMYVNNGTIYDVLCTTAYLACLLWHARLRRHRLASHVAVHYALVTLALNAKEMGLTLPAILLVLDLVRTGQEPAQRSPRTLRWWLATPRLIIAATAVMVVASAAAKIWNADTFLGFDAYRPQFTVQRYLATTVPLINDLFLLPADSLTGFLAVAPLGLLLLLAAVTRHPAAVFGAVFAIITPIPINFIIPRGFFVMYLPLVGWSLAMGTLLGLLCERISKLTASLSDGPVPPLQQRLEGLLPLAVLIMLLSRAYSTDMRVELSRQDPANQRLRLLRESISHLVRTLPPHARLLFLKDQFTTEDAMPVFVIRLNYRDPSLQVDRASHMKEPPTAETVSRYDVVLDYDGSHLVRRK